MATTQTNDTSEGRRVDSAARQLGVSEITLRRMAQRREIGHFRVGTGRGTYRFSNEHIEEYLRGRTVEVAPQAA